MAKQHTAPPAWQAWTVAALIIVGFLVGGIGVIVGWPIFWVGVGIVVVSCLLGWLIHVMEFTEEYELEGERVEPGTRRLYG
ncbi:MAG: HGxxPAAW family protein [Mycobacteriales bacterium]